MAPDNDAAYMADQRCAQCTRIPWEVEIWELLIRYRKSRDKKYHSSWRDCDSLDDLDFALKALPQKRIHPSASENRDGENKGQGFGRLLPSQVDQLRAALRQEDKRAALRQEDKPASRKHRKAKRRKHRKAKRRERREREIDLRVEHGGDKEQIKMLVSFRINNKSVAVYFNHHPNLAALEHAAAMGCYLCRSLRAYLRPRSSTVCSIEQTDPDEAYSPSLFICAGHPKMIGLKKLESSSMPGGTLDKLEGLSFFKGLRRKNLDHRLECLVREAIQPWIDHCDNGKRLHRHCRPVTPRISDGLPTRLIDVGTCPAENVRLVVTDEDVPRNGEQPKYLTLSYCWGQSNDPAKTTLQNYDERRLKIDTECLPRTIQDAIRLTRAMKIRYLWVDALCIIQHLEDFYLEASKMGSYYANGYCLISATGLSDSSEELFPNLRPGGYETKTCTFGYDDESNKYWVLPNPPVSLLRRACHHNSVMKRAWCLQERLLSPRILHVTPKAVVWRCQSMPEISQFFPNPETQPSESITARVQNYTPLLISEYDGILGQPSPVGMWLAWTKLIEQYVMMELSYEDDRLAAIQGLGNQLAQRHGDRYFGGVFLSHLTRGLLWRGEKKSPGHQSTRCPTWSWGIAKSVHFISLECSLISNDAGDSVFPSSTGMIEMMGPESRRLRLRAPLLTTPNITLDAPPLRASVTWPHRRLKFTLFFDELSLVPGDLNTVRIMLLGYTSGYRALAGLVVRRWMGSYLYFERVGYAVANAEHSNIRGTSMDQFFTNWTEDINLV